MTNGIQGIQGLTGNGIASITKTATSGLVDTYTITYTNGNTTTFTVTNGEDGEVTETELNELRQQVEDLEDNQRTNTASGTEIYISDSAKAKVRSIGLTGRSTQESTTGKNKFNENDVTFISGTLDDDGNPIASSTSHYTENFYEVEAETKYTISGTLAASSYGYRIYFYDENKNWISRTDSKSIGVTFDTPTNCKYLRIQVPNTITLKTGDVQIEQGSTATDYEPYTGGEPAPNPNYKFPIKSCGDSGSVNEKISNIKNFLDWNKFIDFSNWANAASPSYMCFKIDGLKANTKYTLCRVDDSGYNKFMYAGFNTMRNNSNLFIHSSDATSNKKSVTTTTDGSGKVYLVFYMSSAAQLQNYINLIQDCWVIEGDSFIEKQEQTLSFPLSQGQKLMEGDYPDDDEKVHHKMAEVVLDGTENWLRYEVAQGILLRNVTKITNHNTNQYIVPKSNYYKGISPSQSGNRTNNQFYISSEGNLDIMDNRFAGVTAFTAWLAEQYANGTPVKIQYKLATEQTEDFTEEQKEAWKEWQKARTYKGGTIISSEDETPANVDIEYVVDVNTIYDRITALENIINS